MQPFPDVWRISAEFGYFLMWVWRHFFISICQTCPWVYQNFSGMYHCDVVYWMYQVLSPQKQLHCFTLIYFALAWDLCKQIMLISRLLFRNTFSMSYHVTSRTKQLSALLHYWIGSDLWQVVYLELLETKLIYRHQFPTFTNNGTSLMKRFPCLYCDAGSQFGIIIYWTLLQFCPKSNATMQTNPYNINTEMLFLTARTGVNSSESMLTSTLFVWQSKNFRRAGNLQVCIAEKTLPV